MWLPSVTIETLAWGSSVFDTLDVTAFALQEGESMHADQAC